MDASVAALLGALIGALTTLAVTVAGYLGQSRRDRRLERAQLVQAKAADLAHVADALATLQIWLEWIIEVGQHHPKDLDAEIVPYGENVLEQLPKLLAAVVVIGSWNATLYESSLAFYHRVLELDERINAASKEKNPQWPQLAQQAQALFRAWAAQMQTALQGLRAL